MNELPLWAQLLILLALLIASGFFSLAETSMMALNRYRLKHLVNSGRKSAKLTQSLLAQTDRLLGVILLGNNALNTLATTFVTAVTIHLFGNDDWALGIATASISFLIIVFAEITPKVIGAAYAEKIALPSSFILAPLLKLLSPIVWFVNLFVNGLLKLIRVYPDEQAQQTSLSPEELRSVVLESTGFFPSKHRSILLNLFDLNAVAVEDVMTTRARVEALDLQAPIEQIIQQLVTCYHNKLPVYEGELNRVKGILHVRKVLSLLKEDELTKDNIIDLLSEAYFIPSGTPVFQQLQNFQENKQRLGLVVDEYGEVQGLVTLEDIIEEMIGEFTTNIPGNAFSKLRWSAQHDIIVDGSVQLRELNRALQIHLPIEGPKTLNGLALEFLQEIPEANVCFLMNQVVVEIVQIEDRFVKTVRLIKLQQALDDFADLPGEQPIRSIE